MAVPRISDREVGIGFSGEVSLEGPFEGRKGGFEGNLWREGTPGR